MNYEFFPVTPILIIAEFLFKITKYDIIDRCKEFLSSRCLKERMSLLSIFYSTIYSLLIGGLFVLLFIFAYDLLYGEKQKKQIRKIHKYFRNETVKKVDLMEHEPKKFTRYNVVTGNGIQKIKMKPGYKVVKIVSKKKDDSKKDKQKLFWSK